MSPRIGLAFACGVALAAGVVYIAVKPEPVSEAKSPTVAVLKPVSATTAATKLPDPAPSPSPVEIVPPASHPTANEPPKQAAARPPSRREKPSAFHRPPAPERVIVAKVETLPPPQPVKEPEPKTEPKVDPKPAPATPHEVQPPAPHEEVMATPPPAPEVAKATPPVPAVPPAGQQTYSMPNRRQPHVVTLLAGTALPVRIGETISTQRNRQGDRFLATLDSPLIIDGWIIAEKGARLEGRIIESDPGGRVDGLARLSIELIMITTADAQHIRVRTSPFIKNAAESYAEDAARVAGGAAIGAVIGALAGGGKGAAIGAGVGGAAGASDVLLTRGRQAKIPVEARVSFRVQQPVTITERLN